MARLGYNGLRATLAVALTAAGTAVSFAAPLKHSNGTNVPTLAGGDYIPLSLLDPNNGELREIVRLTAYVAGATTGTITRAQEGTAGIAHPVGRLIVNAPTTTDWVPFVLPDRLAGNPVGTVGDPNGVTLSGFYYCVGHANSPNSAAGHLTVTALEANTVSQLFHAISEDRMFFRKRQGGVWASWQEVQAKDTGWRDITAAVAWHANVSAAGRAAYIRRIGGVVHHRAHFVIAAGAGTNFAVYTLPAAGLGFRETGVVSETQLIVPQLSQFQFPTASSGGGMFIYAAQVSAGLQRLGGQHPCDEAFPTAPPGVLVP